MWFILCRTLWSILYFFLLMSYAGLFGLFFNFCFISDILVHSFNMLSHLSYHLCYVSYWEMSCAFLIARNWVLLTSIISFSDSENCRRLLYYFLVTNSLCQFFFYRMERCDLAIDCFCQISRSSEFFLTSFGFDI